jgi:predicted PurR-regulated permease PerM
MDEVQRPPGSALRTLAGLAATVVIVAGLRLGAPILVPVALAGFLAVLSQPLFQGLLRRGVPMPLAVGVSVLVLLAGVALFWLLLIGSLAELREVAPSYAQTLVERISYTDQWWKEKGISLRDWIPDRWRQPERVAELAGGAIRATATVVFLLLVFVLAESAVLPRKLGRLPEGVRASLLRFADVSRELQRYLLVKTAMSAAIGIAAGCWLAFLRVDFAVLCGLIAFACHFVPNVGAILAAAPAMLIAFLQQDFSESLMVMAGYLVIGVVLGNLVEPALLGRSLGLSPLVVFLSLVVWGWLWGAIGMLLSVPMTMALRIVLGGSREWAWIAALLDAAPRGSPPREAGV